MVKVRVLVADKQTLFRQGVCSLLEVQESIEIVGEATDGKEILEKVRQQMPDVVLMDLAMPVMDGAEVTHQLRKENRDIKVLFLTEYEDREHIQRGLMAGANGYLPKRATASDLVAAIQAVYRGGYFLYPSVAKVMVNDYFQRMKQPSNTEPYDQLTHRERQVLKLLVEGHKSKEIAGLLNMAVNTVLGHRASIMKKLSIHNRVELVMCALRIGIVKLEEQVG
ncbi:MAG: two component transcriptional regulator, LuxR family [Dehalococcoidales bacterium]|nr:two component transcriptional regulator, LuxR family [Dehalococcoidales bacterium]